MSYLLDTNVVSEIRKKRADPAVRGWFDVVSPASLYVSVLVIGEIRTGIERLRLRDPSQAVRLEEWLSSLVDQYRERTFGVDDRIADEWGRINASSGPLPTVDGLVSATARVHQLTVVTRNVSDFERVGIPVVNPWQG